MAEYKYKQTTKITKEMISEATNYLAGHLGNDNEKAEKLINDILDTLFADRYDQKDISYIVNEEEASYECSAWSGKTRLAAYLLANSVETCAPILDFVESACWGYDNYKGIDKEKTVEWLESVDSPFVFKYTYPYACNYEEAVMKKLQTYFNHSPQYLS